MTDKPSRNGNTDDQATAAHAGAKPAQRQPVSGGPGHTGPHMDAPLQGDRFPTPNAGHPLPDIGENPSAGAGNPDAGRKSVAGLHSSRTDGDTMRGSDSVGEGTGAGAAGVTANPSEKTTVGGLSGGKEGTGGTSGTGEH
ncbi:MAG TPA: hypothetical protein VGD08_22475 [Stellaceae bacterium]|jgi:hypothetical protein